MKRVAIGLLLGATVVGVFVVAAVATADRSTRTSSRAPGAASADRPYSPSSIPPGIYTYEEAKAAGVDVGPLPSEVGLPVCDNPTPDPGYTNSEELSKAIQAAEEKYGEDGPPGRCMADPHDALFIVGGPIKGMPPGE